MNKVKKKFINILLVIIIIVLLFFITGILFGIFNKPNFCRNYGKDWTYKDGMCCDKYNNNCINLKEMEE